MGLKNKKEVVQPVVSIQSSEPIPTIEQVAERLQLKPSTVYELTRRRSRRPQVQQLEAAGVSGASYSRGLSEE